jgi:glycine/D-amino acid oxidase-like deaminating enzyme
MAPDACLWHDTAPAAPGTAPLDRDLDCEIAVIGGGILGLSAALALLEAGVSVAVLEADAVGAGASGRNGGLVVPSLARIGPDRVPALASVVAGAAAATFALIRRLGIDCEAVQAGWLNPAHAATLAPAVRARVAAWQRVGAACSWLDAAEVRRRLGGERFHGALFDPTGGHLNPLAYTRGLARAVLEAGGALHTGTRVITARCVDHWVLQTGRARVRAEKVLQCTNGQPPGLPGPALRDSTVPLIVYQMATPVMDAAARARVLPGNEAFSDTRNNLLACRWTAGGRLVTGGMATFEAGAMRRLPARHAARLRAIFPALGPVTLPRIWRGQAALTGDFVPRLFEVAPGWLAPIACNGRGIALCTVLGRMIGEALAADRLADLPIPVTPPRPLRPRLLARLAPRVLLPIGDWRDRRAEM